MRPQLTRQVARTALMASLTLAFQSLSLPQTFTGPGVNMFLYLAVVFVGPLSACIVGCITPLMGLWFGILKPQLSPMVPVIALSNAVMCLLFWVVARSRIGNKPAAVGVDEWTETVAGMETKAGTETKAEAGGTEAKAGALPAYRSPWVWLGIAVGSVVKYLILAGSVRYIVNVPPPIAAAMGVIQLVNAVIGGVLAMAVARILRRTGALRE